MVVVSRVDEFGAVGWMIVVGWEVVGSIVVVGSKVVVSGISVRIYYTTSNTGDKRRGLMTD